MKNRLWHFPARLATFIMMILLSGAALMAQAPDEIPDPGKSGAGNYIYDPGNRLSADTRDGVNELITKVRRESTCEIAVAVVDTLNGMAIEDYSYQLFKHWGVGKSDNNNGILLVVAPKEKEARIEVGYGAEGVLTDVACAKLLRRRLNPLLKAGRISQGVYGTVSDIERAIRSESFGDELRSKNKDTTMRRIQTISPSAIKNFVKYIAICAFVFTLLLFITDLVATHGRSNYRRAMTWRNHRGIYIWGSIFSLGAALPFAFLAMLFYKHARNKTEICDTCGAKMEKLSEEEDNKYLTPSQDFEEKLKTVDYDVWKCPDCGTVECFPYVERQLKYQECPHCHTIAMNLQMDKVVEPATTAHPGRGVRCYVCQYCGRDKRDEYEIPKKPDASAIAAAAAIGAMAAGSRPSGGSSGGFGGSSFGGGRSGGGGASTRW